MIEDWRLQQWQSRAVGSEMMAAATAVFRKRIDPANRVSPGIDAEARAMAAKNSHGDDTYCQDELENEGFGPYSLRAYLSYKRRTRYLRHSRYVLRDAHQTGSE